MTKYDVQNSNNEIISLCEQIAETPINDLDRLEELYSKLDPILDVADQETVDLVLSDTTFQENRDQLHTKRAHYEYDREKLLADEIIAEHNADVAAKFRSHDWYDKALDFETTALAPYKLQNILFVGSGPFPTSPMAFLRNNPSAKVSCMERYEAACEKAREVANIFGMDALNIINNESTDVTDFSDYDCVIVGLVVGAVQEQKAKIVKHFLDHVPEETLLCFRTADGSGQIIYPSVDLDHLAGLNYKVLEGPPHKSFTLVILERGQ
ncbi:MAG: nicotianamine synthase family protein [Hyphomicrobiales bacterium]